MQLKHVSLWLSLGVHESQITPQKLIGDFCKIVGIKKEELATIDKHREYYQPRQIIMRLIKLNFPRLKLKEIGAEFNRDHSTVLHAIKVVQDLLDTDKKFRREYNEIVAKLSKMNYQKLRR